MLQLFWEIMHISAMMAPYLLFGFLMAGILSVYFTPARIQKQLGKPTFSSVVKAALFGVPLPLCSCGVIPVAASLRKSGASRGAVGAFLISTPQTGVDSLVVTGSFLGWWFAAIRVVLAFVTGLVGGFLIERFSKNDQQAGTDEKQACCCHTASSETSSCCGNREAGPVHLSVYARLCAIMQYSFVTLFNDVAGALAIGLVLAGMINFWVPDTFFAEYMTAEWQSFAVMLVIGLPLYVCSTASVAVGASLLLKGLSPGAVLVFLVVGPASNSATLSAIWKILGKRALLAYLFTVSLFAVAAGMLINHFQLPILTRALSCHAAGEPVGWLEWCACALLFALMARVGVQRLRSRFRAGQTTCANT